MSTFSATSQPGNQGPKWRLLSNTLYSVTNSVPGRDQPEGEVPDASLQVSQGVDFILEKTRCTVLMSVIGVCSALYVVEDHSVFLLYY